MSLTQSGTAVTGTSMGSGGGSDRPLGGAPGPNGPLTGNVKGDLFTFVLKMGSDDQRGACKVRGNEMKCDVTGRYPLDVTLARKN
jgi:hypothetical protein